MKFPRIWTKPTQFQNLSEIFKIGFPGNWSKSLISSESAWFTDWFSTFENKKIAYRKKFWRFLLPEFNLLIRTIVRSFRSTYHKPLKIASFSVSRNLIRPWSCFSRYSHGLVTSEANISLFGFLELYRRYAPYIVFNTQQFVQYSRHSVKMANKILGMYQW